LDPAFNSNTFVYSIVRPFATSFSQKPDSEPAAPHLTSLVFNVGNAPGSLQKALQYFWKYDINLTRIESRPLPRGKNETEFYVSVELPASDPKMALLIKTLKDEYNKVQIIGSPEVPWFPRRPADIDLFSQQTLDAGEDLESDHPGFNDKEYRDRRAMIVENAKSYKFGQTIPNIKYSKNEIHTWGVVFNKLRPLLKSHAVSVYNNIFPLLKHNCGYGEDSIPQLQDVSDFLKDCTGFTIRPVAGLLSPRDFFNALAFRVFFSTQYIRHHSKPLYTPEPDIVHELMGHAPMFANEDFADFSQDIGLASLGATEEQITKLARVYWYTIEFGLCGERGKRKAIGAGLLSSFGELEYSMSGEPTVLPWDPNDASERDYPITTYQPIYYQAKSLTDLKQKLKDYISAMPKQFHTTYDAQAQLVRLDRNITIKSSKKIDQ